LRFYFNQLKAKHLRETLKSSASSVSKTTAPEKPSRRIESDEEDEADVEMMELELDSGVDELKPQSAEESTDRSVTKRGASLSRRRFSSASESEPFQQKQSQPHQHHSTSKSSASASLPSPVLSPHECLNSKSTSRTVFGMMSNTSIATTSTTITANIGGPITPPMHTAKEVLLPPEMSLVETDASISKSAAAEGPISPPPEMLSSVFSHALSSHCEANGMDMDYGSSGAVLSASDLETYMMYCASMGVDINAGMDFGGMEMGVNSLSGVEFEEVVGGGLGGNVLSVGGLGIGGGSDFHDLMLDMEAKGFESWVM
jgi:hypothetical protein